MTKPVLSETQLVILSAACQRPGARVLPLGTSLKGGAVGIVLGSLSRKGLIEAVPAEVGDEVWTEEEGRGLTLRATAAAFEALGIEPDHGDDAGVPSGAAAVPGLASPCVPDEQPAKKSRRRRVGAAQTGAAQDAAAPASARVPRENTKQALLIEMLRRPRGATIEEIAAATGWLNHTVRGAIAGSLKKKLGLDVSSEKVDRRGRVYRIRN